MQAVARKARSGELINETYELKERLETTAISETYRATERDSGRAVRIKLLRPELALQSGAVDAFLRAPRTLHAVRHPNLAQVIAIDTDATGIPFVVEESVEGESLARTMERFPQGMPYDAALAMIAPLVDAVAFTHARGLVHGQLDREHVVVTMIGRRAVPKLRAGAEESPASSGADDASDRVRANDACADVRALGGLLHEVLFGRPPVRNRAQIPGERAAQLPPALVTLVEECLTDRIANVEAVREALQTACAPKARASVPSAKPPTSAKPEAAKPKAAKAAPAPAAAGAIDSVKLGLQATMLAERPSRPAAEPASSPAPPGSSAPTVASRARHSDAPEAFPTVESIAPAPAPDQVATVADDPSTSPEAKQAPVEIKTMSDVAAAFGPIEGTDRIGQEEIATPEAEPESKPPPARDRKSAATVDRKAPPLLSRKQLREAPKPAARALNEEQLRALRQRAEQPESRWSRLVSTLLFLLFAIALVFVVPLLCDSSMQKAQAALGKRAPLAMVGFAALSVFALIRTWALQIAARPMLLQPVTLSLKVVTACTCALAAGYFMPAGMLGPVGRGARMVLPWASGGFYLFLAMYGVTRQLRDAASQPIRAAATALLYCMALVGGHRVLAKTVLSQGVDAVADGGQRTPGDSPLRDEVRSLRATASGKPLPAAGSGALRDAADALQVDDKLVGRKEVGASEADDMTAVDALDDARKQKASALGNLHGTLEKVSR